MTPRARAPWISVVVATLGGVALGLGIGRIFHRPTVGSALLALIGIVLLWWAISEPRKATPGTPESETDGSHTVE